jgi:hypothetical protein
MANPKGLNTLGSWANLVRQSRDQDSKTEDGNGFFPERWVLLRATHPTKSKGKMFLQSYGLCFLKLTGGEFKEKVSRAEVGGQRSAGPLAAGGGKNGQIENFFVMFVVMWVWCSVGARLLLAIFSEPNESQAGACSYRR